MKRFALQWAGTKEIKPFTYTCGYCGYNTTMNRGYSSEKGGGYIVLCGGCNRPTFFEASDQTPKPRLGNDVDHLPEMLDKLYLEARDCTQVGAFTACVLICRKILMHMAVQEGAKENLKFIEYVEYLDKNKYIPPKSRAWVDHIRNKGNEANHEIVLMDKTQAMELLSFTEMLLKFVYEFPARIAPATP